MDFQDEKWDTYHYFAMVSKLVGAFGRIEDLLSKFESGKIESRVTIMGIRGEIKHQSGHIERFKANVNNRQSRIHDLGSGKIIELNVFLKYLEKVSISL